MALRTRAVSFVLAGAATASAPAAALAQDPPPPPPPPTRAELKAKERFADPTDPSFRGAVLGDLSEQRIDATTDERVVVAVGGVSQPVWIRYPDFEVRCESAVLWGDRERLMGALEQRGSGDTPPDLLGGVYHAIYAEGGVFVRRGTYRFHADRVLLDLQRHRAYLVDVRMQGTTTGASGQSVPLVVRAGILRGTGRDRFRAEDAVLTSCTYENPHLAFTTSWVEVDWSKKEPEFETGWWPTLRAETVVGRDLPLLPLPKLGGALGSHGVQTIEYETSSRLGHTVGLGYGGKIKRDDGSTWGSWQVTPRYRTRRGPGLGVEFEHDALPDGPGRRADRLDVSGEIQRDTEDEDHYSDLPFDGLPGGTSQEDRGRFDLFYRRWLDAPAERDLLGEGWRLDVAAAYHSDRGYIPEYEPGDALNEPQRDTYLHLRRLRGNQGLSLLGSYRVSDEATAIAGDLTTDYAVQTEYLPSATWHLVNQPVVRTGFAPVNLSVEAGAANVERRYDEFLADVFSAAGGWRSRDVQRGDLETRVTVPFEVGPLQVTPAFGGSLYHVSEANGFANAGTDAADEDEGRAAAFAGIRVGAEAHRTYDVRSSTFSLDGLRHVASFDAQWFDRFHVSDDTPFEFQTNDLHDQLFEQNVVSLRLRNRLQTRRAAEVVDWIDYEARFLWYAERTDGVFGTPLRNGLGLREDFPTPLERIDFPGEDKYLAATRDGSAFHQHRARMQLTPGLWLVGEADYDMNLSRMETSAGGVRWFADKRFSVYLGRRTIHDDSQIWTIRGDYVISDKWGVSAEVQDNVRNDRDGSDDEGGLRTRVGLFRRTHDFTMAVEFESERLLDESSFSFVLYPHHWLVRRTDPFSRRRPLDFDAQRWYR